MTDSAVLERPPAAAEPAAQTTPDGVFLIHGLGGTQYDLGSMHKRLKNAGFVTHSLTLPGHGTNPLDLAGVTAEDWVEAVIAKYREVRDQHPKVHVMGMCMGALLAAVVAQREKHAKGNLVMLAPPVFIDGWATPWYRGLRPLLYHVPGLGRRMKIEEEDPFGIKNEQLRAIVKAKFERGENFHYQWVPLECLRQVDRLRAIVMKSAKEIRCPTLVVHAREDELTSLRSANFVVEQIGGGRARMVVLEDSYHMICVDNDREIVAKNVLEFVGAAMPGATSTLANEPRMSRDALAAAVEASLAKLGAGDFSGLRDLAIPDLAWVQPGANKVSGAHMGKTFGGF
jgi:carboxylesterase